MALVLPTVYETPFPLPLNLYRLQNFTSTGMKVILAITCVNSLQIINEKSTLLTYIQLNILPLKKLFELKF